MNRLNKKLLILTLILAIGGSFAIYSVQAQNNNLILEVFKECDIQHTGDGCTAELKVTNNTDEILDGEASLHIDYKGVCGDGSFDGEGIKAQFSNNDNWLNFSGWEDGTTTISGFKIAKGETQPKLKIKTVPNLCPGEYTFSLELKGTKAGEIYPTTPTIIGGGGGGYYAPKLEIRDENILEIEENQATIAWLTTKSATSRVVYGTTSGQFDLSAGEPSYGYEFYSDENTEKAKDHSITLTGLTSGVTYYYRCVSHGSFAVSTEYSFTTLGVIGEQEEEEEEEQEEEQEEEEEEEIIVVEGETEEGVGEQEEEEKEPAQISEETEAGEEEENKEENAGLSFSNLLAAIGNIFKVKNIYWLLLFFVIIIIILFFLSRKKKRKEE